MSGRAFEKECGLANGSYSSIGNGVGADKLNKILSKFPQISADWLISGQGEMMKKGYERRFYGAPSASGSVFASSLGETRKPLNREDMKTILFQVAGILSDHQQELSRIVSELEQNGKRSDRLLDIIEQSMLQEAEFAPQQHGMASSDAPRQAD